ncbi:ABC transporter ATP-binding protein/permease [Kushneria phosphatilytica]|uniref:ABC transporter ATP-binding protein/permease n=1 Tax=Kushneria phosphatilytica TaxID=657387 RepID=UPI0008D93EA3|nr:ABC transporter ATP-binding protein/permease [Kushneria phosphatilytica]OHV11839.1 hypothetical protein BH688_03880 [Kushneria phosphatilytica]
MSDAVTSQHHRRFLTRAWALARPYWQSEEKWSARGLLALIVALALGSVYLNVLINSWYSTFYNTLQSRDVSNFWHLIGQFSFYAGLYIASAVAQYYLTSLLQIRWRRWLTHAYFDRWLQGKAYYHLEQGEQRTDNPDQRISEDIDRFTDASLNLSIGLLSSVVTLISFITILWSISGALNLTLAEYDIHIPGYMVWAAILYAGIGSWLTHRVGRRLIRLNFNQQRVEADMRFDMARLRENSESIALYGGEESEKQHLRGRFTHIWANFRRIMTTQKRLIGFTSTYNQLAVIFPLVVAAPRYFSGAISLGTLMQISNAFGQVQSSLSWFVDNYARLASWRSVVDRLTAFNQRMDELLPVANAQGHHLIEEERDSIQLANVRLRLPDGQPLITIDELELDQQHSVLIQAPSGSGKSVLIRALAGIWPWWQGTMHRPKDMLFLPQTPYLPIATLREALLYPYHRDDEFAKRLDEARLHEVLTLCRLEKFDQQLDENRHWSRVMSPGEQQRLAMARALLHRPRWLVLDEATSALDLVTERHLYATLTRELPHTTLISVAHRDSLSDWHQQRLSFIHVKGEHRYQQIEMSPIEVE